MLGLAQRVSLQQCEHNAKSAGDTFAREFDIELFYELEQFFEVKFELDIFVLFGKQLGPDEHTARILLHAGEGCRGADVYGAGARNVA